MDDEDKKEINYRDAMAEILNCNDFPDVAQDLIKKKIEEIIRKYRPWTEGDWVWCRRCRKPVQFGKHPNPPCLITDIESLGPYSHDIQEMEGFMVGEEAYFNGNKIIIVSFDFSWNEEPRVWGKWVNKRIKGVPYPLLSNLRHEPYDPPEIINNLLKTLRERKR